jgi:uncharacterized protein GlcG (DUF336 family)
MPNLTLEIVQQIIAASLAGERSSADRHVAVAVCDAGANPRTQSFNCATVLQRVCCLFTR